MKEAEWLALIAIVILIAGVVRFAFRGQRRLGTPMQRASHVALHTANLAAPALRTGLNQSSAERSISHLRNLLGTRGLVIADVDGVLLYRGNAPQPDGWLLQSFPQIQFADQLYRTGRQALRARTCLLANPSPFDQAVGVQVIPCGGDPTPETLQPFFDHMMQTRPAHAGA